VRDDERSLFKQIEVVPSVDFNSLEEVFVILRQTVQPEGIEP
jgi:cell shape-determining protein MreC